MLTWTTYGTWLQGDERGYVKNGQVLPGDENLLAANAAVLAKAPVKLSADQRKVIEQAILKKAEHLGQKVYAAAICSNHVHLVTSYVPIPVGTVVRYYKNASLVALRQTGFAGRVWTKGFDKRYCFDELSLRIRIDYVNAHNRST
jgi:REP element-mobilizing transposase RayT